MPAATATAPSAPSRQETLLLGLENSGEQSYARIVGANYGFRISNRWERTVRNVADDIASTNAKYQNCTVDNLERLVDRVIISANHHYSVYQVSSADAVNIRQALSTLVNQQQPNIYAQTYPALVDFESYTNSQAGHYLCKVVDMGDGFACIFASVVKEAVSGYRALANMMITTQFLHTVFVPNDEDRVEVRISDNAPARHHENHTTAIKLAFKDLLVQQNVTCNYTQVNFFDCISSYFGDATVGRIAHAVLTTGQDSKDAELKSLRDKDYCARTQQVTDTQNNFTYVCRAILIRKPYSSGITNEVDISFFPHKNTWEADSCWSVQIKKPQTSMDLNSLITDAIARS